MKHESYVSVLWCMGTLYNSTELDLVTERLKKGNLKNQREGEERIVAGNAVMREGGNVAGF